MNTRNVFSFALLIGWLINVSPDASYFEVVLYEILLDLRIILSLFTLFFLF